MTANQRNRLAMLIALSHVFNDFKEELSSIPAQKQNIESFFEYLQKIKEAHKIQQGYSSANSKLKTKEEAEMIQATVQVAAAIYVYAHSTNQPGLKSKVSISPSSLQRLADKDLEIACVNIYDLALTIVEHLADYGITPESIAKLKKEIDDFAALIASPRSEIVTRSQATAELRVLFTQMDDLLRHKIDKLMVMFEMAQPKAYKTYLAARIIVDLKGAKTTEETTIEA